MADSRDHTRAPIHPPEEEIAGEADAPGRLVIAILVVAAAAFSFAFQETGIIPSLVRIQRTLPGATTSTVTFLESGYLVLAAISATTLGRLGDRRGKKPVMLMAMGCYMAGAIGAAFAPNLAVLVVFRSLQGVGGAIFALSLALMRKLAGNKLQIAVSGIIAGFGLGITAGFASSGVISANLGWRYIFAIESMLIMIAGVLVWRFLPDDGERSDVPRDLTSSLLLGGGVGALLLSITLGPVEGWSSWEVLFIGSVVIPLLVAWWVRSQRIDQPLVRVSVLTERNVLLPNLAAGLAGYAAFSTYLVIPRLALTPTHLAVLPGFHAGLGLALTALGLLMMPIGIGTLVGSALGGAAAGRVGGKWSFAAGMCLLALGPALLAAERVDLAAIGVWLFVTGVGFGSSVSAAGTLIIEAAPEGETGVATSINTLSRLTLGGIGSQVGTIILIIGRYHGLSVSHPFDYDLPFVIAAGLALLGALLVAFVTPRPTAR